MKGRVFGFSGCKRIYYRDINARWRDKHVRCEMGSTFRYADILQFSFLSSYLDDCIEEPGIAAASVGS